MSLGPAEITGIVSAVTAVVGAVATFIYKVRGRPWREVFKSVIEGQSEEVKELSKTLQEQAKVAKTIIEKELDNKKKK